MSADLHNNLNATMGVSVDLKITGDSLTQEQRDKLSSLLVEKAKATTDFEYESKHTHVIRAVRADLTQSERTGTYLGLAAGGILWGYTAMKTGGVRLKYGGLPAFLVGGLVFDFWTASDYNLYNAVGARVNRHYSQRFGTMMDINYD